MGVSKAEVNLKRLLRAQVHQTNDAKLVHYVATMRSLLADLTGDPQHQELATIPASRAREYAHQIDAVAERLRGRGEIAQDPIVEPSPNPNPDFRPEEKQFSTSYVPAPVPSMRRRLRGDDAAAKAAPVVRVDASLQSLVHRHRQLQEGLTDEMVMLSAQLKEGSLLMDQALHETDRVLESTEDAVEASLASTNRANVRMGSLSSQSWKTSCLTWLILFVVFGMFMFMVVLIRVT
jgi:SNARE protein 1